MVIGRSGNAPATAGAASASRAMRTSLDGMRSLRVGSRARSRVVHYCDVRRLKSPLTAVHGGIRAGRPSTGAAAPLVLAADASDILTAGKGVAQFLPGRRSSSDCRWELACFDASL